MSAVVRALVVTSMIVLGAAIDARSECAAVSVKPMSANQLRSRYDLIFTGVVRSASGAWPMGGAPEVTFLVDQVWKGKVAREMPLLVHVADTDAPLRDRALLILARRCRDCRGGERIYLVEGPCKPGIELNTKEAQALLLSLGPGKTPNQ